MFRIILHYRRTKRDYQGWGMHLWGASIDRTTWHKPLKPLGEDDFGTYWIVRMEKGAECLNFVLHRGDEKDYWEDLCLDIQEYGREVWMVESDSHTQPRFFLNAQDALEHLSARSVGDVRGRAQAYWLDAQTIAWHIGYSEQHRHTLHFSPEGGMEISREGVASREAIPLTFDHPTLTAELAEKFPHIRHAAMLRIPDEYRTEIPRYLRGQCVVSLSSPDGIVYAVAAPQIGGALDDLYAYDGKLGVEIDGGRPVLRLWAPTAVSVRLHRYALDKKNGEFNELPGSPAECLRDESSGVWTAQGEADWLGNYYLYEVEVFVRQEGRLLTNYVTDPYSISLALNSTHSQILDLNRPHLFPRGWDRLRKDAHMRSTDPVDLVLYELHVRDFSAADLSVPEERRGSYLAFSDPHSNGMRHLKSLADAGVTHIHLLPVADFASVDENKVTWIRPDFELLESYPPNSYKQQAVLARARGRDGYNWGYDPYHYLAPEGSYALDANGEGRVIEFRSMVLGLYDAGLRIVMDVVFNHTYAAGQDEQSVLDRIVPGYYYRLDNDGGICNSTCCANTASERKMMGRLIVDAVLHWALAYQVDGFRFDLMGHTMKEDILNVRRALDALTVDEHGVDGKSIYIYGEGWDFGEVAGNARGVNASQWNMQGSGIGTFNDRIREALRGGGPFGGKQEQGFISGLYIEPNESEKRSAQEQRKALLEMSDKIKIGLAGNLARFPFVDAHGFSVSGLHAGGYTAAPQENVAYVSAHDNETLFDAIQYKAARHTPLSERVRMQNLAISIIALCQGVPFFHAGCELLRSKSMDRDSYDSGDWFNRLDFTCRSNNFGVGLPPQQKNDANWPVIQELLARQDIKPTEEHMRSCMEHFTEMLRIRRSSPLFRLRSAEDILQRLHFYNQGPFQMSGLIVMGLLDLITPMVDMNWDILMVFYNTRKETVRFSSPEIPARDYRLHPVLVESRDPIVRKARYGREKQEFSIPGRTAAVFIHPRSTGYETKKSL